MNLTPEERRKIYEEEKARLEEPETPSDASHPQHPAGQLATSTAEASAGFKSRLPWFRRPIPGPWLAIALAALVIAVFAVFKLTFIQGQDDLARSGSDAAEADKKLEDTLKDLHDKASKRDVEAKAKPHITSGISSSESTGDLIRQVNKDISYEKVKKNPDKYKGEVWAVTGKILEIDETDNYTVARVGTGEWGLDVVWVEADFTTDFVGKNRVYVVGYLQGSKTYESQAGWTITIPSLKASAILKPSDAARLIAAARKK
jgi:hypothetical protein